MTPGGGTSACARKTSFARAPRTPNSHARPSATGGAPAARKATSTGPVRRSSRPSRDTSSGPSLASRSPATRAGNRVEPRATVTASRHVCSGRAARPRFESSIGRWKSGPWCAACRARWSARRAAVRARRPAPRRSSSDRAGPRGSLHAVAASAPIPLMDSCSSTNVPILGSCQSRVGDRPRPTLLGPTYRSPSARSRASTCSRALRRHEQVDVAGGPFLVLLVQPLPDRRPLEHDRRHAVGPEPGDDRRRQPVVHEVDDARLVAGGE